jgi:hypothetical protein
MTVVSNSIEIVNFSGFSGFSGFVETALTLAHVADERYPFAGRDLKC